jgi:hypothetical protein
LSVIPSLPQAVQDRSRPNGALSARFFATAGAKLH